jgi:hypothetical protein
VNDALGLKASFDLDAKRSATFRDLPAGSYTIRVTNGMNRGGEPKTVTFTLPGTTTVELP